MNTEESQFNFSSVSEEVASSVHPDNFIDANGKVDRDAILDKMAAEEDAIRDMMQQRRIEAAQKEEELQKIIVALKKQGYDQDQINTIFSEGLLTREVIDELISTE